MVMFVEVYVKTKDARCEKSVVQNKHLDQSAALLDRASRGKNSCLPDMGKSGAV